MKRLLDIVFSLGVLTTFNPVLLLFMFLVWRQDGKSPFYMAPRVGKDGKYFKMVKLRSMVVDADKTGVHSTSAKDSRITDLGRIIRRYKLDEFTQFWNVLIGDMSLVGPRPQVKVDVDRYTEVEQRLLSVKPGVTDFSSIVFADEGEILRNSENPDLEYSRLIRPWKSRLGLLYIDRRSVGLDLSLVALTALALVSRRHALKGIQYLLRKLGADERLIRVASRETRLVPTPPPGGDKPLEILT
jgi:lipopolysaccharide/colanic/teichoic acid biosynthesis glycosyltransferase